MFLAGVFYNISSGEDLTLISRTRIVPLMYYRLHVHGLYINVDLLGLK